MSEKLMKHFCIEIHAYFEYMVQISPMMRIAGCSAAIAATNKCEGFETYFSL
jgi:hypothetical protein